MPETGEIISGKYRILERLGSGAMGIVYSARHLDTDKQVALKWLNPAMSSLPDGQERFRREAKATGRIHHPNVVAVHDCGEHEGQLYLVMEYLAGSTLRATLTAAKDGRFSLREALDLLFPVMRGISAAHATGVLHRDLKPENVLLSESPDGLRPIPKVLDFGLAKVRSEAASFAAKLSMPGSVLGTYQYMAPEQLRPQVEVDERIDVYALGAMLYEMLSGQPPYHADNPVDLVLQIHAGEVPQLDGTQLDLPEELSAVLARALARDREQRFASVDALAVALEPFTDLSFRGEKRVLNERPAVDAATAEQRAPSASPTRRPSRQERWLRAGLGLLALFTQPTTELTVANSVIHTDPQQVSQPSTAVPASSFTPTTSEPIQVAPPPTIAPQQANHAGSSSNEDWLDERAPSPAASQPKPTTAASPPTKAAQPTAAARGAVPLPPRPARVDARPTPPVAPAPAAGSTPDHRSGPGTLGVNEF